MIAIYLWEIAKEGGAFSFPSALFALLMTLGASAALVGAQTADNQKARIAIVASAAIFVIIGIVLVLSIGIGFLLAACVASIAADRLSESIS